MGFKVTFFFCIVINCIFVNSHTFNFFFSNGNSVISHFTVVCLVTWPLSGSEAGGALVLMQTLLLFTCTSCCSHANYFPFTYEKHEVCFKTRSTPASLPLKGQVTRHTTVKWLITELPFEKKKLKVWLFTKIQLIMDYPGGLINVSLGLLATINIILSSSFLFFFCNSTHKSTNNTCNEYKYSTIFCTCLSIQTYPEKFIILKRKHVG